MTELWIVCHGFGQLARDFLPSFEPIAQPGRLIVAPEALSRFYKSQGVVHTPESPVGATWMTREDRTNEIADYVLYLDALLRELRRKVNPDVSITALGFSQGAATVSRWVAASRPMLRELVLWGGLLPPEFNGPGSLGGLTAQPLRLVVGKEDRYFSPSLVQKELERLGGLGLTVNPVLFEGGHTIDAVTLRSLIG